MLWFVMSCASGMWVGTRRAGTFAEESSVIRRRMTARHPSLVTSLQKNTTQRIFLHKMALVCPSVSVSASVSAQLPLLLDDVPVAPTTPDIPCVWILS